MKRLSVVLLAVSVFIAFSQVVEPRVKEGYWSVHIQITNNPGNIKQETSESICRSHAYDQYANQQTKTRKGCKVISEKAAANTYTLELECNSNGSVVKNKSTTTYTGDTAFRRESHSISTPPQRGVSESTVITEERYAGSCPAGSQPGDITRPDGSKFNNYNKK